VRMRDQAEVKSSRKTLRPLGRAMSMVASAVVEEAVAMAAVDNTEGRTGAATPIAATVVVATEEIEVEEAR